MFDKKTVILLGAGASCQYGFPSARQLTAILLGEPFSNKTGDRWINNIANTMPDGHVAHGIKAFQTAFRKSALYSVDLFVRAKPDFEPIAKFLIAKVIQEMERVCTPNGGWLEVLWNEIYSNHEKLEPGSISFVTFNYDRLVEQYFSDRITHTFDNENRRELMLTSLPVYHVYGSMGELDAFPFGDGRRAVDDCPIELMRVGKQRPLPVGWVIQESQRMVILGFGFDSVNMNILSFGYPRPLEKEIFACVYGLSASRRIDFVRRCDHGHAPKLGGANDPIDVFIHDHPVFF